MRKARQGKTGKKPNVGGGVKNASLSKTRTVKKAKAAKRKSRGSY